MTASPLRRWLPALLLTAGCARAASVETDPAAATAATPAHVVYLVRHAEKADDSADPPLSDAGRVRADALRERLRDAGIGTVIVSDRRRTAETADPLARAAGLAPIVVATSGGGHVAAVADAVRRAWSEGRGPVLVAGHSNTVPAIARALGAADAPDICESEYANLWIVTVREGAAATLRRESFGTADAPARSGCPAMAPAR
jgi:broad specificity phosphatase PhoE